jgi:hypothetical protein
MKENAMDNKNAFIEYVNELKKDWYEVYTHEFFDVYDIKDLWHEFCEANGIAEIEDAQDVPSDVYTLGNKWF